ncbi:MAG: hypothetical protein L0Z62_14560, partial [Gemmataceae bacterium]|nr:hypothetical protein [Gemmataceae bacterium]
MAKANRQGKEAGRTDAGAIPPGATREALDRPLDPGGGAPGSGAGPRHAAGDPGGGGESTGRVDTDQILGDAPIARSLFAALILVCV